MTQIDFIFGLGIFLFGMSQLEKGIRRLSDARLRFWLRNSTKHSFGSITLGVVSTALLQSSSMVSLLVLAFASAGLLPLVNAIGVILGANLGTTMTGWIVATIGFKLDLEALSIPILGISSLVIVMMRKNSGLNSTAIVFLGIGLLLFGLSIMKASTDAIPERWDVSLFQGHHPAVYLLLGVIITFLIQSSSAVMMMALAALNTGIIGLGEAAALVIGADLGTTSTTILGSIYGNTIKRKLAFAHCSFNFIVDITAFLLLLPFLGSLLAMLSISDPLYGLVAFHSIMNLLGLIVFVPFLTPFSNWIEKIFAKSDQSPVSPIEKVPPSIPDAAIVALQRNTTFMALQAICNSLRLFSLHPEKMKIITESNEELLQLLSYKNFEKAYEQLKFEEGAVLRYSRKVQSQPLSEEEAFALDKFNEISRAIVYSNKTLKDISKDLDELKRSSMEGVIELYHQQRQFHKNCYHKLLELLLADHADDFVIEELAELQNVNNKHFLSMNNLVQASSDHYSEDSSDISSQLNLNHEVHHAAKSMLNSIQELIVTRSSILKFADGITLPAT